MISDFSVIEVNDKYWSITINKCVNFDFYHTQAYHQLEVQNRPLLFVLTFDEEVIALPLIIRQIPNSKWYDCTSVYGYCGPISSLNLHLIAEEHIAEFQNHLLNYFRKNDIITAFSRLHPLIPSGAFFNEFGLIRDLNKTIAIDLKLSPEEQRQQFRKSNKSELNQLRRKGYEVKVANSKEDIDSFIGIYTETMKRVNASDDYFYNSTYFHSFLNSTEFEAELLVATFENNVIAGAIFTITNNIMQYHLAGTSEAFIKLTPMKLIIDEARLKGNDLQLEYLHLGGGVAGSDDDSLFRFKTGFSKNQHQYQVWQYVIDQEKYALLNEENQSSATSDFFPLYRS